MVLYRNMEEYICVLRAHRLARWANHAWGLLPEERLAEVWNLYPCVPAFCQLLPGIAVARGWIVEGPVGYGVLAPDWVVPRQPGGPPGVVVNIGAHGQIHAEFWLNETSVEYYHGGRHVQASVVNGLVSGVVGYCAAPRDWARIARLLIIAEEPTDSNAEAIRQALRDRVGDEPAAQVEYDKYFALTGPEILAGPEVILGG
jgi:hypothetical protein